MKRLVLVRHGQSAWNKSSQFTDWTDVDLTEQDVKEAHGAGRQLRKADFHFGGTYTSYLKRAIKALNIILDKMSLNQVPVGKSQRLNEKHCGMLQGLDKSETTAKYGEERVHIWRHSYDVSPASLDPADERAPQHDSRYASVNPDELPLMESLKEMVQRILPYWESNIRPDLERHDEIIVATHGNSLRDIAKHLKGVSDEEIPSLNLPTGIPYVFELDDRVQLQHDYFLGNPKQIAKFQVAVANQGKSK